MREWRTVEDLEPMNGFPARDVRGWPAVTFRFRLACLFGVLLVLGGCVAGQRYVPRSAPKAQPLTASGAIGLDDAARDASLRLVVAGLEDDEAGRPSRALASYQRAVRVDPTNPFAFLALSRHHLQGDSIDEASAFLDQARSLFESEQRLGPSVDVWGVGLRAGIDRAAGRTDRADALFERARELSPEIWGDERLSAEELR
jgi:tetratricopeptide (TPR) repeat protein